MIRVFQIGFHVCGTRSLWEFFRKNNFQSFHHENHKLAEQLYENLKGGKTHFDKDLEGPFSGKQGVFYSDMQSWKPERDGQYNNKLAGYTLFKEIDKGYPNSLFILNLRDGWVESKIKKGGSAGYYTGKDDDLKRMLNKEWNTHIQNVREYFGDRKDFIEFHIQKDPIDKLITWIESFNIEITKKDIGKIKKNDTTDIVTRVDDC